MTPPTESQQRDDEVLSDWSSFFYGRGKASPQDVEAVRAVLRTRGTLESVRLLTLALGERPPTRARLELLWSGQGGIGVFGGRHWSPTFDPRIEWANVTANRSSRPPLVGFSFGPLSGVSIGQLETAFGPLDRWLVGHNEDETRFAPGGPAGRRIASPVFVLSGEWSRNSDGTWRHRLRYSSKTEPVEEATACPERVEFRFRAPLRW